MPITLGRYPVPFPFLANQTSSDAPKEAPPDVPRSVENYNPHVRLFSAHTISVAARERGGTPGAPKDSLDLSLSSCYDHHCQFWAHPATTKIQRPAHLVFPLGRCQQRLYKLTTTNGLSWEPGHLRRKAVDSLGKQHDVNHESYRNYSTHIDCHISGSHTCSSARGFGRGIDGLFYNS